MNFQAAEPPPPALPAAGWSRGKILLLIVLAGTAHLAFVFLFGAKKVPAPRTAQNVLEFNLAGDAGELARLTDPTLFVVPHAEDFPAGVFSAATSSVTETNFHWTEAPTYLANDLKDLGTAFRAFMQTNRLETAMLKFKPEPQFTPPAVNLEPAQPQTSSWQVAGALAGRRVLNDLAVPVQTAADILAPSRVQLLVAADGNVLSTALLESSGLEAADRQALKLAQSLRFTPAAKPVFGEILFNWRTAPARP
jgi:TonB family protein